MNRKFIAEITVTSDSLVFDHVEEVTVKPFPEDLSLLDSFKRANEEPLNDGGKWAKLHSAAFGGQIFEEAYSPTHTLGEGEDGSYWTAEEYAESGVAAEVRQLLEKDKARLTLYACITSPTTASVSGYRLVLEENGANSGKFTFKTEKLVEGTFSELTSTSSVSVAAEDSFGLSVEEGKVKAWHKPSTGSWTVVNEHADSTYTKGFIGIGGIAGNPRVIDFQGGSPS